MCSIGSLSTIVYLPKNDSVSLKHVVEEVNLLYSKYKSVSVDSFDNYLIEGISFILIFFGLSAIFCYLHWSV
jgi:hypothetical protein